MSFLRKNNNNKQFQPSSARAQSHGDTASATAGQLSSSSSLQSVAAKFQERALQLTREQGLVEQTQKTLDDLMAKRQLQERQCKQLRCAFLQARQERDAAEADTLALQTKSVTLQQEIRHFEKEIETFQAQVEQDKKQYELQKKESLMIPHRTRQALYLDYLQGRVQVVEQSERNREQKRTKLAQAIHILQQQRQEMEQEKRAVDNQVRDKTQAAMQKKAETQELSAKVRAALAERKQLRNDLRQAKAVNDSS